MPLYIAFIDLSKTFDLVSRDGLFYVLPKIDCPPKLQSMIASFHTDTKGTVQFNGSSSEPFEIRSGVKEGRFDFICGWLVMMRWWWLCWYLATHERHLVWDQYKQPVYFFSFWQHIPKWWCVALNRNESNLKTSSTTGWWLCWYFCGWVMTTEGDDCIDIICDWLKMTGVMIVLILFVGD